MWFRHKSPYSTLKEYYDALDHFCDSLRAVGFDDEATELHRFMHSAWTTGSELLGELIGQLDALRERLPDDCAAELKEFRYFARHHRRILKLD